MERPRPRLLGLLLVLLAAASASAQPVTSDPDPTGDTTSDPGVLVDEPTTDLVNFTVDVDGDELVLRNEVLAALPAYGVEANATRLYTFLFVLDLDDPGDQTPLVQTADSVIVCRFHQGLDDLQCEQSVGERVLRGVGVADRNATVRIALEDGEDLSRVRGAGAVTLTDETDPDAPDILSQDFTPTAVVGQDFEEKDDLGGDGPVEQEEVAPWYKTRTGALMATGVLLVLSYFAYKRLEQRPRE